MMHGKQIENTSRGDSGHDFSSFFSLIEKDIRDADIAIANMEFTLGGKPYTGYPSFSAPDGFEEYLADCGFDIFLAANNHIFDKGAAGAERTLTRYRKLQDEKKIRFTGLAGSVEELAETTPLTVRAKGMLLSFINFTYGTNQSMVSVFASSLSIERCVLNSVTRCPSTSSTTYPHDVPCLAILTAKFKVCALTIG